MANPDGKIVQRDLSATAVELTDAAWLAACFTPPPQQSPAMQEALALFDVLVQE